MVAYYPKTLQQALEIRAAQPVIPYAGGTDLMVKAEETATYLFLNQIEELAQIREEQGLLCLGAGCTFTQTAGHPAVPPLLKEAMQEIAAPAIRNFGTLGGNIGNGSPKADSALIFFVLDAQVKLASVRGQRIVPIQEFYLGRNKTQLAPDELIVEILLPAQGQGQYYYEKIGARKALAISRVSFAGVADIHEERIQKIAVAFGAIADMVVRRADLDAMLCGLTLSQARQQKGAYLAAYQKAIQPIRGRISAEYRKEVCMDLLQEFLAQVGIE